MDRVCVSFDSRPGCDGSCYLFKVELKVIGSNREAGLRKRIKPAAHPGKEYGQENADSAIITDP